MQRNNISRRSIWFLAIILTGLVAVGQAQQAPLQDADQPPCSDCHICMVPTAKKPCLKQCMRDLRGAGSAHTPAEGPKVAILDQLVDFYQPVRFNHKLHAEMVGMGEGCAQCHHYSPAGKIPPCRECHGQIASETQDLRKPGLKGAFHRQCMGCHREWSHATECVICHIPREGQTIAEDGKDQTDIVGIKHPLIPEPAKKVYYTPYEAGPMVTFYHKEHIDLFGLRCVNCHQKENCAYCHDFQKPANLKKTDEEVHAICTGCHGKHKCSKCHDTREKPAFSHSDTGWPLSRYHVWLDCRACHPTGKRISRLNRNCVNCHGGWNQETFAHAVTGLRLDEIHYELECGDCHIDRKFQNKPDCAGCHDDGRSPKENPPGNWIKTAM